MSKNGNHLSNLEKEIQELTSRTFILLQGTLVEKTKKPGNEEITVYARGSYYCVPAEAHLGIEEEVDPKHRDRKPWVSIKLKPDAVILQKRLLTARILSPSMEAEDGSVLEPCPWDGSEKCSVQCLVTFEGGWARTIAPKC